MLDAIAAVVLLGIVGVFCLMGLIDVVALVVTGLTSLPTYVRKKTGSVARR